MAEERVQRRLAAILAADVVGYSRLMEADDAGTLATLKARRHDVLEPLVAKHQGRVFKVTGDGVLVEFGSAVNAAQCAVDLQQAFFAANSGLPADHHIVLRIGVNLGDVMVEGGDLYGDGINVAARLESIAEPGGILLSGAAYDHVKNKITAGFEECGAQRLKNIAEPVRVYRVTGLTAVATTKADGDAAKPAIAVLPFTNIGSDPEQQYFSDGITEDIITELSRFRQLRVLARNSSFAFRGQSIDIAQVGRQLGVQYMVEGSVRRVGNRIRITAQLVETGSGHHVWAERFDSEQEDLFTIQDQVVRTIVGTLVGRLQASAADWVNHKPPASLTAYEYLLRGNALPFDDPKAAGEARRLFGKAIELDPGYARAYALLADLTYVEWWSDMSGSNSGLDRAFELAIKAVSLDESDYTCQGVLGWTLMLRQSHELAEQHYLKALELNRNRPSMLASLGGFYAYLGKPAEGMKYLEEAKLLDPFFEPTWYWRMLGVIHFAARRYDESIVAFRRSPTLPFWGHAYVAACHALTDRTDRIEDSRRHAADVLRLMPDFSLRLFAVKEPYKHPTDRERLIEGLRKAGLPE